jgi:hypothetical protein
MKGFANEGTSTQTHMAKAAYLRQRGAFAFENMVYKKGNQWMGKLRNGSTCTFCMKGLRKDKIITVNTRIITVWPD